MPLGAHEREANWELDSIPSSATALQRKPWADYLTSLHLAQLQSGDDACAGSKVTVYPSSLQTQQRHAGHPPASVKDLEWVTSHPLFPPTEDF